jgi:hypothetical protein
MIVIEFVYAMIVAAVILVVQPLILVMMGIAGVLLLWLIAPAVLIAALVLWLIFPVAHGALVFVLLVVIAALLIERNSRQWSYRERRASRWDV